MHKMINSKLILISLLCSTIILISCNSSNNHNSHEDKATIDNTQKQIDQVDIDSTVSEFIKHLKTGKDLSSFFTQNWSFVYHEDNRCEGSTDGQLDQLDKTAIDSSIKLEVKNDGDAWACEKKDAQTFELAFELKKKVKNWDRFELQDQDEKIFYIVGAGESDYVQLHFGDNGRIVRLEYRSEDPG